MQVAGVLYLSLACHFFSGRRSAAFDYKRRKLATRRNATRRRRRQNCST